MTKADLAEAAAVLRRVLDAVERGDLDASGPAGAGLVRQLQGALIAIEALAKPSKAEARIHDD